MQPPYALPSAPDLLTAVESVTPSPGYSAIHRAVLTAVASASDSCGFAEVRVENLIRATGLDDDTVTGALADLLAARQLEPQEVHGVDHFTLFMPRLMDRLPPRRGVLRLAAVNPQTADRGEVA